MTTPTTTTDAPPEKKKKERKPRTTSKYIVVNVLKTPTLKENPEANDLDFALNHLGIDAGKYMDGKIQIAVIEGPPQHGIIKAREYVETNKVSGKQILICCVRRDGSATPVNGIELKGL